MESGMTRSMGITIAVNDLHTVLCCLNYTELLDAVNLIIDQIASFDGKILICGNGGSASQAEHFTAELTGKFMGEIRNIPAICINSNVAELTSTANDLGYEKVYQNIIASIMNPADVLICLTTSGTSPNIISALKEAKSLGGQTIGITGNGLGARIGTMFDQLCDIVIAADSTNTQRIQEAHLFIIHLLCQFICEGLERKDW